MSKITIKEAKKQYGDVTVIEGLNLEIRDGELFTLLGPSGCGKTTLLRMIAGFNSIEGGDFYFNEERINDKEPSKRNIGMVFQNYAIFPHLTVEKNVAFGLKNRKLPKDEIRRETARFLEMMQIEQYADRLPENLSGGQQQRVALARALVIKPDVLLMDEPLSNLDAKLRLEMRYELQRLHVETGSTFVYVTHDQMEAMTLATRICLINNGVLQQYDAPLTVYSRPGNLFVADFVGNPSINFVEGKGMPRSDGSVSLDIFDGVKARFVPSETLDMKAWKMQRDDEEDKKAAENRERLSQKGAVEKANKDEVFKYHVQKVTEEDESVADEVIPTEEDYVIGIRPEAVKISADGKLASTIYGAMPTGMESTLKLRIGEYLITGVVFGNDTYAIGSEAKVSISGNDILLFDRISGKLICAGSLEL